MCRGCGHLAKADQEKRFKPDSVTPYDPPLKLVTPFCRAYGLHVEWVAQLRGHEGNKKCFRYWSTD